MKIKGKSNKDFRAVKKKIVIEFCVALRWTRDISNSIISGRMNWVVGELSEVRLICVLSSSDDRTIWLLSGFIWRVLPSASAPSAITPSAGDVTDPGHVDTFRWNRLWKGVYVSWSIMTSSSINPDLPNTLVYLESADRGYNSQILKLDWGLGEVVGGGVCLELVCIILYM